MLLISVFVVFRSKESHTWYHQVVFVRRKFVSTSRSRAYYLRMWTALLFSRWNFTLFVLSLQEEPFDVCAFYWLNLFLYFFIFYKNAILLDFRLLRGYVVYFDWYRINFFIIETWCSVLYNVWMFLIQPRSFLIWSIL